MSHTTIINWRVMTSLAAQDAMRGRATPNLEQWSEAVAQLTPLQIASLDPLIRVYARDMVRRQSGLMQAVFGGSPHGTRQKDLTRAQSPELAAFIVHANNGYLREVAVRHIDLSSAAAKTALILRTNDWVDQIRGAAQTRLQAALPLWTVAELRPLVVFAVEKLQVFQRGGAGALAQVMASPSWHEAVEAALLYETHGPLARVLRELLRQPTYDATLEQLATRARSVAVRSVAAQTVLEDQATWRHGTRWTWEDESKTRRRKVPIQAKRRIGLARETQRRVGSTAAQDRSPTVRKHAADALIRCGPAGYPDVSEILKHDRSKSVSERMAFFDRKWRRENEDS